jgi:hypothetical protein
LGEWREFLIQPETQELVPQDIGVLIEIVPCEVGNVVGPREVLLGIIGGPVNEPSSGQSSNDTVVDFEILSAGLPVYLRLENKLLVAGKLLKPVPAAVAAHPTVIPMMKSSPNKSEDLRE